MQFPMLRTWCDESVWLDGGLIKMKGNPTDVVEAYTKEML